MVNELAVLILIAASGASASWLLGIRNLWLSFGVGIASITLLRVFTFEVLSLFAVRNYLNPVFFAELFVILLIAAWRGAKLLYQGLWVSVAMAVFSTLSTRLWQLSATPKADSLWILSLTRLFDSSGKLSHLNRFTAIKRGFSYPLMLSLGPQHEYLSGFTPFVYLALVATVIWSISVLVKAGLRTRTLLVSVSLALAVLTAVMPLRTMYYIGGHSLVAIGYTLVGTVIVLAVRSKDLSRTNLIVLCVGSALATCTSAEAIVIVALASLVLLSRTWMTRSHIAAIAISATLPFVTWLACYNSYLINYVKVSWWIAIALSLAIALVPSLQLFDPIRLRSHILIPTALTLFLVLAQFWYPKKMLEGYQSLVQNLFGGSGDWGMVPYLVAVAIVAILLTYKKQSASVQALTGVVILAILGSLVAKIIGGGQLGDPTLGRFSWTDSLNRMWFNILPLAFVLIVVSVTEWDWQWNRQKSGKLDKAKS